MDPYHPLITAEMMRAGSSEMTGDPHTEWDEMVRGVFTSMMSVVLSRPELASQYLRLLAESTLKD